MVKVVPLNKTNLNTIPRIFWANLPTPLDKLNNLISLFRNVSIFMKRDDLTGHCFGGNKERKLEFIMGNALEKKAKTIVTVGVLQSNHCRMTTAFANRLGLKTELILIKGDEDEPIEKDGNYFLAEMMGAKIHVVKVNEVQDKINSILDDLRNNGEHPYFIEGGGHNVLGAIGYIYAIKELKEQTEIMEISPDYLVLPTGTGTTQAGLILGKELFDFDIEVIGISVSRSRERCVEEITSIIEKTADYLHLGSEDFNWHIEVNDEYIGKGYRKPTEASTQTIRLIAEKEGLIVDPVFNAKALSGMLDLISKSTIEGNVIYMNTGGFPALFTRT